MFEYISKFFEKIHRKKSKVYRNEVLPPLEERIKYLADGIKTIPKYLYDGE